MPLLEWHGRLVHAAYRLSRAFGAMSSRCSVQTGPWSHVIQVFGSNRPLKPCHPRGGRCGGKGSMASRAVTIRFLLLCPASHRFPPTHMPVLEWHGRLIYVAYRFSLAFGAMSSRHSVQTGLWSHVVQVFGSNRPLEPCHPRGGRCGGLGSMASRAVIERFLLLCSASHRFLPNPHASAGMTWEADLSCFSVVTGLWNRVIQALGSNRHLQLLTASLRQSHQVLTKGWVLIR